MATLAAAPAAMTPAAITGMRCLKATGPVMASAPIAGPMPA